MPRMPHPSQHQCSTSTLIGDALACAGLFALTIGALHLPLVI